MVGLAVGSPVGSSVGSCVSSGAFSGVGSGVGSCFCSNVGSSGGLHSCQHHCRTALLAANYKRKSKTNKPLIAVISQMTRHIHTGILVGIRVTPTAHIEEIGLHQRDGRSGGQFQVLCRFWYFFQCLFGFVPCANSGVFSGVGSGVGSCVGSGVGSGDCLGVDSGVGFSVGSRVNVREGSLVSLVSLQR